MLIGKEKLSSKQTEQGEMMAEIIPILTFMNGAA